MSIQDTIALLDSYVDHVAQYLRGKMCVERASGVAGWHNFFKPGRIGTTGSAVPLLFFTRMGLPLENKDQVLRGLLNAQRTATKDVEGGWSILSVQQAPTVEGTVWPILALAEAGDMGCRPAVLAGEGWLYRNQHESGGWGPNKNNNPRVLLTSVCLRALRRMICGQSCRIEDGLEWLRETQNSDGGWGPIRGASSTAFHTACAGLTLAEFELAHDGQRIAQAKGFLEANWTWTDVGFQQEIYDVHHAETYSRVVLEHDTLAEVVSFNVAAGGLQWPQIQLCVSNAVVPKDSSFVRAGVDEVSVWNLVPMALAARRLKEALHRSVGLEAHQNDSLPVDRSLLEDRVTNLAEDWSRRVTKLAVLVCSSLVIVGLVPKPVRELGPTFTAFGQPIGYLAAAGVTACVLITIGNLIWGVSIVRIGRFVQGRLCNVLAKYLSARLGITSEARGNGSTDRSESTRPQPNALN